MEALCNLQRIFLNRALQRVQTECLQKYFGGRNWIVFDKQVVYFHQKLEYKSAS
jgi:hypothetical protein